VPDCAIVLKARIVRTPLLSHLIPDRHSRCFIIVFAAASVTPDPIGKFWSTCSL